MEQCEEISTRQLGKIDILGTHAGTTSNSRDLNIRQRITYVQVYLLSKLWYTTQVLQLPSECLRQIVSAVVWYIWQSAIFRVLLSTL